MLCQHEIEYVAKKGGNRFSRYRGVVINMYGKVEAFIKTKERNKLNFLFNPHKSHNPGSVKDDGPITHYSYHWMYAVS